MSPIKMWMKAYGLSQARLERISMQRHSEEVNCSGVVCIPMKLDLAANRALERDAANSAALVSLRH